jgi:hypothetical protein
MAALKPIFAAAVPTIWNALRSSSPCRCLPDHALGRSGGRPPGGIVSREPLSPRR